MNNYLKINYHPHPPIMKTVFDKYGKIEDKVVHEKNEKTLVPENSNTKIEQSNNNIVSQTNERNRCSET